jgi:hypothetical protein
MTQTLRYLYHPTENRLLSVQDAAPPAARHLGFKPGGGQPAPYQYDQNGNLTLDTDKNLPISYNFLNLPSQMGSLGGRDGIPALAIRRGGMPSLSQGASGARPGRPAPRSIATA